MRPSRIRPPRARPRRAAAVADGPDHTGNPVGHPGVGPDAPGDLGVGGGELDREHPGSRRGTGDAHRPVTAVGTKLEGQSRVRPDHCRVEQRALLVADVDQERLLVGELVDGGDDIVDVARAGVGHHIIGGRGLSAVAPLTGAREVSGADSHPDERPPQQR